jgi:hypothetical protein
MYFAQLGRVAAIGEVQPTHPLVSQAQPIRMSFSLQKGFITD